MNVRDAVLADPAAFRMACLAGSRNDDRQYGLPEEDAICAGHGWQDRRVHMLRNRPICLPVAGN